MNNGIDALMDALEKVNELMTPENLKEATTEQLLEYNEKINRIKAILLESLN